MKTLSFGALGALVLWIATAPGCSGGDAVASFCQYSVQCGQETHTQPMETVSMCEAEVQQTADGAASVGCTSAFDACLDCALGLSCAAFEKGSQGTSCEQACNAYTACVCQVNPDDEICDD